MEKLDPVRISFDQRVLANKTLSPNESPQRTADTFLSNQGLEESALNLNGRTEIDFTVSDAINRQGSRER